MSGTTVKKKNPTKNHHKQQHSPPPSKKIGKATNKQTDPIYKTKANKLTKPQIHSIMNRAFSITMKSVQFLKRASWVY